MTFKNVPGGVPVQRPDQLLQPISRAGSGPAPQSNVIRAREVIVSGPSGGLFVYNAIQTVLEASIAGAPTHDPILGFTVPQGIATYNAAGRVINLLSTATGTSAFFQYRDRTGIDTAQGILILAVSSIAGNDPVTATHYPVGLYGVDFGFGSTIQTTGAIINLGQVAYTRNADVAAHSASLASQNPYVIVDAPEQTTAEHMQMLLQGDSPDGTSPSQCLVGRVSGGTILTALSNAMMEIQDSTGSGGLRVIGTVASPANSVLQVATQAAGDNAIGVRVTGDANNRMRIDTSAAANTRIAIKAGPGSATFDSTIANTAANLWAVQTADWDVATIGRGLRVAEGSNAKQGTGTLAAGTATIANTSVTASSRILVTGQPGGANRGGLNVTTITAGTSFVVTSTNAADTGNFAYEIFEPG